MPGTQPVHVLIVGGSYAGLQAALVLGRARRSVVVVDANAPRNARAAAVNAFWGQQAPPPEELLGLGRAALEPLGVAVVDGMVRDIVVSEAPSSPPTFTARLSGGQAVASRAVLIATGIVDLVPDVPGVSELWGRDVVACPHCHGWESRSRPLAVLGLPQRPDIGVERALLLRAWSDDVVLCTDGGVLTSAQAARLRSAAVEVRVGRVSSLDMVEGRLHGVRFADDRTLRRERVFVAFTQVQASDVAARIGCRLRGDDSIAIETDALGRTTRPGVWAAGSAAFPSLLALGSAGHGGQVATAMHSALLDQDGAP